MLNENKFSSLYLMCEKNLQTLDAAFQGAISMPISEARLRFLLFLDRERNVYAFGLALLKEIQDGSTQD
jgi:hypothetical protein